LPGYRADYLNDSPLIQVGRPTTTVRTSECLMMARYRDAVYILHFEEYTNQRSQAFARGVNQIIASFKPTR
jgi:hypothetical protein